MGSGTVAVVLSSDDLLSAEARVTRCMMPLDTIPKTEKRDPPVALFWDVADSAFFHCCAMAKVQYKTG
jgi:hypothetical protein